mmetsp:Transcript_90146/g.250438  ORF Transcript_90146/g.250438 Transcript_90146/m.250438 type:complete len:107 (+) Transcript_90146:484-804(+)
MRPCKDRTLSLSRVGLPSMLRASVLQIQNRKQQVRGMPQPWCAPRNRLRNSAGQHLSNLAALRLLLWQHAEVKQLQSDSQQGGKELPTWQDRRQAFLAQSAGQRFR